VVQILAHLLRCQPRFRDSISIGEERGLDLAVEIPSSGVDDLRHLWSKLRDHLGVLAWLLIPVITEIFEARWRWQATLATPLPMHDPWTWDRSWVEGPPSKGDEIFRGRRVGPLIDIGKDVLDELLAHEPEKSVAVIEMWLAAGAPQLIQLGLYGLAKSSQWRPAKKLETLVAEHLPAKSPFKVETFRVLRESYPNLSSRQRRQFLKQAEQLYRQQVEGLWEADPDRYRRGIYEWFNVLTWLERATPSDSALKQRIKSIRKRFPEFQPQDHPELGTAQSPVAEWIQETSRLTSEEIAQLSPDQWLEELEASRERQRKEGLARDHMSGFLEETARTASDHLSWGLSFTHILLQRSLADHAVWPRILAAWGDRAFKPDEWEEVLKILDHPGLLAAQTVGITEVVRGRTEQQEPKATEGMIRSGLRLAEELLPLAEEIPFAILSEDEAWMNQAINHPGGLLAEFLISATSELLGPNPARDLGIPSPCRPLLDAMIGGTGRASQMGRVRLASDVHYLLWIDSNWTRNNLLPLFDWDLDVPQAVQAWHGFLAWGRLGAALLEELTTSTVKLASHLEELGSERKNYGKFIARAASSIPDDPLSKPWFRAFLSKANDDDRAHFAWMVDGFLEMASPEQRGEIWRDWLDHYLVRRTQFPPVPEGQEITALAGWVFRLPEQLAEVADRLEKLPGKGATVDQVLWKLQEGELAGSDPDLLARLVLALLQHCDKIEPWDLTSLQAVIERLIDEGAQESLIRALLEKYLEHGGPTHQDLLERLRWRNPPPPSTGETN
jgi:hypothetical protein